MNYNELYRQILLKKSYLCIGLDSDIELIPSHLKECEFPVFEFNRQIIDATYKYAVAYKPNLAFYEALGSIGWKQLEMTVDYIRKTDSGQFIIADAKRGDIGNTAQLYARAFFENFKFDAVTLSPYMGKDSIDPFLSYKDKWAVILALTSNPSASDFETVTTDSGDELFKRVIKTANTWGTKENVMFVVGATRPEKIAEIRKYCPYNFFLVPGVGAQGGTIKMVSENGLNDNCGLLINISRSIIFASGGYDFADAAAGKAKEAALEMESLLRSRGIIR